MIRTASPLAFRPDSLLNHETGFKEADGACSMCTVQVTASRIQLCSLAGVAEASGADGGSGRRSSGGGGSQGAAEADPDSPRPSMGKRHASWATMEGIADSFASRLLPFRFGPHFLS